MIIKKNNGGALVLVLLILVVLTILGASLLSVSLAETKQVVHQDKRMQAFYLARSGADTVGTYIIKNPGNAKDILGKTSSRNNQLGNGEFEVKVEGSADSDVYVRARGFVGNVSNTATLQLKRLSASDIFDKAIYSSEDLDITGTIVNGDIQSGGTIEYSTNGHHTFTDKDYPNSKRYIQLPDPWPDPSFHDPASIIVKNSEAEKVNKSYKFSSIEVGQNGRLVLEADSNVEIDGSIKIVVDNLIVDNSLDIIAANKKRVELYINTKMVVTTKGVINNLDPKNLIIYLKDGSKLEIQAGKVLNAYIIGPDAEVEIQSDNSTLNGAVICKKFVKNNNGSSGNGRVNYVPIPKDDDFLPSVLEYRIVQWDK